LQWSTIESDANKLTTSLPGSSIAKNNPSIQAHHLTLFCPTHNSNFSTPASATNPTSEPLLGDPVIVYLATLLLASTITFFFSVYIECTDLGSSANLRKHRRMNTPCISTTSIRGVELIGKFPLHPGFLV